ncbi:MAG: undecaprenyl-diphosphate phosphatase [Thermodesulfobacteriota bacterium]
MENLLVAFILGIVEGLTEFLPVSSTGHLILAGHLLGFIGPKAKAFEIVIQLGAILAVVVLYRERFAGLVLPRPRLAFSGLRGLWLLFLTSLPAGLLGLAARKHIHEHLFGPTTVAIALAAGALAIFAVEARRSRPRLFTLDQMTPGLALGIGLFQCLALWPGFSRSAATIMGGMLLGCKRGLAAEYSFIAAVPLMAAATGYELFKSWSLLSAADLPLFAVGFAVSFVSAWLAVKWFVGLVSTWTLRPFAVYRLALAPLVFLFWGG